MWWVKPAFLILLLEMMLQETQINLPIWDLCNIFWEFCISPTWEEDERFFFSFMHIDPAHCALRWTVCYRPSESQWASQQTQRFSNTESGSSTSGEMAEQKSQFVTMLISNHPQFQSSSETEMARMKAFRHTTPTWYLKLLFICFAANPSYIIIVPQCNKMIYIFIL